jgi:uncharacterized membrane protein YedE/YeeE
MSISLEHMNIYSYVLEAATERTRKTRLIGGAAIFGIGWGIAGFCPGGAIPAIGLLHPQTPVFLAAMIAGIIIARLATARVQPATE